MALHRSPQPVALPQHGVRRADAVEVHTMNSSPPKRPHHVADAEVLSQDAGDIVSTRSPTDVSCAYRSYVFEVIGVRPAKPLLLRKRIHAASDAPEQVVSKFNKPH